MARRPHRYGTLEHAPRYIALLLCTALFNSGGAAEQSRPPAPRRQPDRSSSEAPPPTGATILLQSDLDCTFAIDDQSKQPLKAGETTRVSVSLGEHLVTAVSLDGKDHWKTVVNLESPVQKVVLVELVKLRAARQAAERQVIQLRQEIAAKEQQAREVKQKTEALAEQQKAVKKQRQQIEDQISALEKQARQEEAAAPDGRGGTATSYIAPPAAETGPAVPTAADRSVRYHAFYIHHKRKSEGVIQISGDTFAYNGGDDHFAFSLKDAIRVVTPPEAPVHGDDVPDNRQYSLSIRLRSGLTFKFAVQMKPSGPQALDLIRQQTGKN